MSVELVIAVRGGPGAKSRCGDLIDGPALAAAMLADMVEAARACPAIAAVHVVTPTPDVATGLDVDIIREATPAGLDAAFTMARAALPDRTLLLLPGDLPQMRAADLAGLVAAHRPGEILIVPSATDGGTGAILIEAQAPMRFAFGPGSFARHMAEAGARARRFDCAGLAEDLDRPTDLARARTGGGPHSRACLARQRRDAA